MAKQKTPKTFLVRSRAWATKNGLFGPQAFLRFVMLSYLEAISKESDDFVFKGGNLLWVYIETPRATVDLDLATLTIGSHAVVRQLLENACGHVDGIKYSVQTFKEIESDGNSAAAVTVAYETEQGAKNRFDLDIVYRLVTDAAEIDSPVSEGHKIRAATIENIIADKLSASHRFKSGNSRMKDYDDLWRLAKSGKKVAGSKLATLLKAKSTPTTMDATWISANLETAWRAHASRYKDLPEKLGFVFEEVNAWLGKVLGSK